MLNISKIDTSVSKVAELTTQLSRSLKRPSSRTLRLIDKALLYLTPFESSLARVTSASEKKDLLDLLNIHRMVLTPYIDTDRIACNLRHSHGMEAPTLPHARDLGTNS